MNRTALGYLLVVKPQLDGGWEVVSVSRSGRWAGGTVNLPSKEAAQRQRRKLVRLHRRLAARKGVRP